MLGSIIQSVLYTYNEFKEINTNSMFKLNIYYNKNYVHNFIM